MVVVNQRHKNVKVKPNTFCLASGKLIGTMAKYEVIRENRDHLLISNGYGTYVVKRRDIIES